jgi:hypothetical protein
LIAAPDRRLFRIRGDEWLQGRARLEHHVAALVRAEDIEPRPELRGERACLALDIADKCIVVAWIVVRQREPLDAGGGGDLHHVVVGAVSPGLLRRVLLGRVLGIVDHEVGIRHENSVPAVTFVQDRLDAARLCARAPQLVGKRLVVHQVHDRHTVGFDPVAHRHRGVIEELRGNPHTPDRVDALGQLVIGDRGRELVQFDGEVGELHLAREHVVERAAASLGP